MRTHARVIVVTGASSGLDAALAKAYAGRADAIPAQR